MNRKLRKVALTRCSGGTTALRPCNAGGRAEPDA